ncbi:MAG: alpha/beta fold hydrolase [Anaeroplasmataceae bacterium]|nr:alpha/beta fold hydrolase [Anaeroplasmataceae bacterium]
MIYIIVGSVILGVLVLLFILAGVIHHNIFGKRWMPNGITKYYEKEEYVGLEAKEVSFIHKNNQLRGFWYSYPLKEQKGIIVFAHGMWGSHKAYLQEIEYFANCGYQVLGFDYTGTELSDGKNIVGLGNSLACLDSAISYVKQNYPNENISVIGHSWGAYAAANILKYHPDINHVIAMSGFVSLSRILKGLFPKYAYIIIPFIIGIDYMHCGKYSLANSKKTLKKTTQKVLILHSEDDTMVSYQINTKYLKKKLNMKNLQFLIVSGKNHNPDYTIDAIMYSKESFAKAKTLSGDEKISYLQSLDYHRMGALDSDIMSMMVRFLEK